MRQPDLLDANSWQPSVVRGDRVDSWATVIVGRGLRRPGIGSILNHPSVLLGLNGARHRGQQPILRFPLVNEPCRDRLGIA